MRETKNALLWVVYQMTIHNKPTVNAVCEQGEWAEMERSKPGYHTLIQSGIESEAEAEKLARGASGDARKASYPKRHS